MTYYEVLEIDSRASTSEIERAFRRMARKVHPDLNAGDRTKAEAHMKLLNEIRETLTDPLLRAGYDERLRLEWTRRESAVPPRAATPRPGPAAPDGGPVPIQYPPPREAAPPPRSHSLWVGLFLVSLGAGVLVVALVSSPRIASRLPGPFGKPAAPAEAGVNADPPPLLTVPVTTHAAAPAADEPPAAEPRPARRSRGRVIVRVGSTAEDVLRALGQPDRYEPGPHPGESVLHYGALRLEMKNGRVVGGDAAAR